MPSYTVVIDGAAQVCACLIEPHHAVLLIEGAALGDAVLRALILITVGIVAVAVASVRGGGIYMVSVRPTSYCGLEFRCGVVEYELKTRGAPEMLSIRRKAIPVITPTTIPPASQPTIIDRTKGVHPGQP